MEVCRECSRLGCLSQLDAHSETVKIDVGEPKFRRGVGRLIRSTMDFLKKIVMRIPR